MLHGFSTEWDWLIGTYLLSCTLSPILFKIKFGHEKWEIWKVELKQYPLVSEIQWELGGTGAAVTCFFLHFWGMGSWLFCLFVCFLATHCSAQGLLMALQAEITPGGLGEPYRVQVFEPQICFIQDKCLLIVISCWQAAFYYFGWSSASLYQRKAEPIGNFSS